MVTWGERTTKAITPTFAVLVDLPPCHIPSDILCDPNSVDSGQSEWRLWAQIRRVLAGPIQGYWQQIIKVWFYRCAGLWACVSAESGFPASLCWTLPRSFIWNHRWYCSPCRQSPELEGSPNDKTNPSLLSRQNVAEVKGRLGPGLSDSFSGSKRCRMNSHME